MEKSFLALSRPSQDGMFRDFLESRFGGVKLRKEGFQEKTMEEKERCRIRRRMAPETSSLLPAG
jgi:hypothetical protein